MEEIVPILLEMRSPLLENLRPMSRTKSPSQSSSSESPVLQETVIELMGDVKDLTDEIIMLRDAVDDLRAEYEDVVRDHRRSNPRPIMHITSLPKNPCDPNFGAKINRIEPADLPLEKTEGKDVAMPDNEAGSLF